jgi:predicted KAP-like P-loop ATPase
MFLPENPIEKFDDDFLGRKKFSEHLSKAVSEWKEKDSLVIALYGKWGIGKTSLLNMTIDYLEKKSVSKDEYNIIRFNPWAFSESDNLLNSFIQELISAIKKAKKIDKKLIRKLEYYSSLFSLAPAKEEITVSQNAILSIIALSGITVTQIKGLLIELPNILNNLLLWGGIGYFTLVIVLQVFRKLLLFFKVTDQYNEKSVNETKNDIVEILRKKQHKMLIVIDDIDRLSTQEIRQIFRIIRTNADFPNTIYLLAFDRDVIEQNLAVQEGISGHDYLEKIVQVNFTLPCVSESKIYEYLFSELDRLLSVLPESANQYFKDGTHWANVFHSGFKNYFKSIRDIKRFINSLEFNISQLIQEDVIEVNPIDFLAVELLRLFEPQYYNFLQNNKSIFTEIKSSYHSEEPERSKKKIIINESFSLANKATKDDLRNMIFELFPQVKGFANEYGNVHFSYDSEKTWTQELRLCSNKMFDSYFNFIPGGDEKELSIYDLTKVSISSKKYEDINDLFNNYKSIGKFENLIVRLQDYTTQDNFFIKENTENVIQALFDSFVNLPKSTPSFLGISLEMQIARVIFQLLKRNTNLEENYQILENTTIKSKSLYGPLYYLGIEIHKNEKETSDIADIITVERIPDVKRICTKKIIESKGELLNNKNFLDIILKWKEWSGDSEYHKYINDLLDDNELFLAFFDKFEYETRSQTSGDYGVILHRKFNYKCLAEFCDLNEVKLRIEKIKSENSLYEKHKSSIDLFLKYFEKRNNDFIFGYNE